MVRYVGEAELIAQALALQVGAKLPSLFVLLWL